MAQMFAKDDFNLLHLRYNCILNVEVNLRILGCTFHLENWRAFICINLMEKVKL